MYSQNRYISIRFITFLFLFKFLRLLVCLSLFQLQSQLIFRSQPPLAIQLNFRSLFLVLQLLQSNFKKTFLLYFFSILSCFKSIQWLAIQMFAVTWTPRTVVIVLLYLMLSLKLVANSRLSLRCWGPWGPTPPSASCHVSPTSWRPPKGPPHPLVFESSQCFSSSRASCSTFAKRCPKGVYLFLNIFPEPSVFLLLVNLHFTFLNWSYLD